MNKDTRNLSLIIPNSIRLRLNLLDLQFSSSVNTNSIGGKSIKCKKLQKINVQDFQRL